jgi:hypothetical protein
MTLKLLYTLTLLLGLSTFASSNECSQQCRHAAVESSAAAPADKIAAAPGTADAQTDTRETFSQYPLMRLLNI